MRISYKLMQLVNCYASRSSSLTNHRTVIDAERNVESRIYTRNILADARLSFSLLLHYAIRTHITIAVGREGQFPYQPTFDESGCFSTHSCHFVYCIEFENKFPLEKRSVYAQQSYSTYSDKVRRPVVEKEESLCQQADTILGTTFLHMN